MSSIRNAVPRKAHKERAQPNSRKKFGILEKHKDYVQRARAYHQKEQTIQKLKEKAAFRNPDEFYFKMIKTKTVDGVHKQESQANKYTKEELMLMKTQDIGYISQKAQAEKKKIEKLTASLHFRCNSSNKHVYYAEDREEARQIKLKILEKGKSPAVEDLPNDIKRKIAASYKELEDRKSRVKELDNIYADMTLQKELQKQVKSGTLFHNFLLYDDPEYAKKLAETWGKQKDLYGIFLKASSRPPFLKMHSPKAKKAVFDEVEKKRE
ncbi:putative U3 small nucleolar RNA-associated protein 11 [Forsythia ovata]|uniref:U3 small nucleolar RNA-associated protein 11 n=1 Tax=Forsythia ovata TaxID=205694 RepID=A0ABD1SMA2_9LAMI